MTKKETARTNADHPTTQMDYSTLPDPKAMTDAEILATLCEVRDWLGEVAKEINYPIDFRASTDSYSRVTVSNFKFGKDGKIIGNYAFLTATRYDDSSIDFNVTKNYLGEFINIEVAPDNGFYFGVLRV